MQRELKESLIEIIKQNGACVQISCCDCYFTGMCVGYKRQLSDLFKDISTPSIVIGDISASGKVEIAKKVLRELKLERICQQKEQTQKNEII